jgi:hypothetical protein
LPFEYLTLPIFPRKFKIRWIIRTHVFLGLWYNVGSHQKVM